MAPIPLGQKLALRHHNLKLIRPYLFEKLVS